MDWITYALGYISQHDCFTEMVEQGWVSTETLRPYIKEMDDNWGGFGGVLTWLRLYDEDKRLADQYARDFLRRNDRKHSTWFEEFDDEYTEEQWRSDLRGPFHPSLHKEEVKE
tara:strand:- start:230 stop:568 length:339 start_codon:yes stop_codon:yes gene_type:complete